jgi:hypothetical protein
MTTGGKGSQRKVELAERRVIALELRKQGGTYRQIAEQIKQVTDDDGNLRWPKYSEAQAHRDVMNVLKALNEKAQQEAEHIKGLEIERIDALWSSYFPKAMNGDYASFDRCMALMDKRARYQSIPEAPQVLNVDTTTGGKSLDAAFEAALLKVYGDKEQSGDRGSDDEGV